MENPLHARIEKYLDGTLPPDERASFEAQVAADPNLGRELRLHEAARGAVSLQALIDRRGKLQRRGLKKLFWKKWQWKGQDALNALFVQQRADGARRMRWGLVGGIGLAAIFLLLYWAAPDLFSPQSPAAPKPMAIPKERAVIAYNTYFKRIDLSGTLGSADTDARYENARKQYADGNCPAALEALAPLLADESFERRPMALLLTGTCLLEQGDTDTALETLRQVPPAAARPHEDAQWYIALALLKQERSEEASALLRDIAANARHRHYREARSILNMEE